MGCCRGGGSGKGGEELALLAVTAVIRLAQGRSTDELGVMAAFFTVLGDQLGLIAVCRDLGSEGGTCGDVKSS
ncbi:DUF6774 domain-containing protein [Intestinimonas timonensis]|uniref:DUF6774 domain-containing protein n=1 Tax=Intestinimonas timonensis TaxID=1689270 RepID=UPI003BF885A5